MPRQSTTAGDMAGSQASAEDKLETRRLVDGAKSVLMDRSGMTETEAFGFIQKTAMGTRSPNDRHRPSGARGHARALSAIVDPSCRGPLPLPNPPTAGHRQRRRGRPADPAGRDVAGLPGLFRPPARSARPAGVVTNAVHGFASMVVNLVRDHRPSGLAVAFDLPGETFRDEIDEEYKGGRAADAS